MAYELRREQQLAWSELEQELGRHLPLAARLDSRRLGGVVADGVLREIALQGLALERVPRSLALFPHLETMDLGRNHLRDLPAWLGDLPELRALLVRKNHLVALPAWCTCSRLESLNVGQNPLDLQELARFEWPTHLRHLHLNGLELTSIPEPVGKLSGLERLSLYRNRLTALPLWLTGMGSLQALTLGENELENLPEEICHLRSLSEFSVYRNRLSRLPGALTTLLNLEELGLHENRLVDLPRQGWNRLEQLRYLALFDNHLPQIPEEIWALPSLESLLLHHNPLVWNDGALEAARRLKGRGTRVSGLLETTGRGQE